MKVYKIDITGWEEVWVGEGESKGSALVATVRESLRMSNMQHDDRHVKEVIKVLTGKSMVTVTELGPAPIVMRIK